MKPVRDKNTLKAILSLAGIEVDGDNPWDIKVHDDRFYRRVLSQASLGLGEAYMDGWWDCDSLDELFFRILHYQLARKIKNNFSLSFRVLSTRLFNMQSMARAFRIGEKHYDLDYELFSSMLDRRMVYSSAYWKDAQTLDEAQENKLDLICRKVGLQEGMRVLDIGCGWGGFIKYAAEKYGVEVVGITISKEQREYAAKLCRGLPVEIRLQDYRSVNDKFDHIVSKGMFEHVGYKNYRTYMNVAHRCLKDGGLFLLHTIGGNTSVTSINPWLNRYIFPDAMLPSIKQIGSSIEGLFVMEDWHNFSADYEKTLIEWHKNFDANWKKIKSKFDDRFYRMWKYYLLSSAGAFRSRTDQLWQIVLSKRGVPGGYRSIR